MVNLKGNYQKLGTVCTSFSEVRVSPILGSPSIMPVSSVISDPGLEWLECSFLLITVQALGQS